MEGGPGDSRGEEEVRPEGDAHAGRAPVPDAALPPPDSSSAEGLAERSMEMLKLMSAIYPCARACEVELQTYLDSSVMVR